MENKAEIIDADGEIIKMAKVKGVRENWERGSGEKKVEREED